MELEEYIKKLQGITQDGVTNAFEQIAVPEANELLANIKVRISQDGKGSNNSKLAPYSTNPMYAVRNEFVKKSAFKPIGKTGKKTKASMYLPQGYKQLRDIQGRRTDITNFEYSGVLLSTYQLQAKDKVILLGFVNDRSAKIRKGLEAKRGKTFYATDEEMKTYNTGVATQAEQLTKRLFKE